MGTGFLISPCQFFDIKNFKLFKPICVSLSAFQLYLIISIFSWKVLEAFHICHLIAKVCTYVLDQWDNIIPWYFISCLFTIQACFDKLNKEAEDRTKIVPRATNFNRLAIKKKDRKMSTISTISNGAFMPSNKTALKRTFSRDLETTVGEK